MKKYKIDYKVLQEFGEPIYLSKIYTIPKPANDISNLIKILSFFSSAPDRIVINNISKIETEEDRKW